MRVIQVIEVLVRMLSQVYGLPCAVVLNVRNEIKLTTYSSIDEEVDFVQFSEIYVNDVRKGYEDRVIYRSGQVFLARY